MKKLLIAAILSVTASTSFAGTIDICNAEEAANTTLMKMRQMNMEMSRIIKISKTQDQIDRAIAAYEVPLWSSQKMKDKAVKSFANKYYLECIKKL